jgi:hypothetical protein
MSFLIPLIQSLVSAGGSALGGYLNRDKGQAYNPTPIQRSQKDLLDQLIASVKGNGPFSDMFNFDEEAFQKSYVDPAKQMFSSQIAPQIQQGFISQGQQRGTGMENQLTRAGVDMDQLLNQAYAQMQQNAQQNKMGAINSILGMGAGPGSTPGQSAGSAIGQGLSGYMAGGFGNDLSGILSAFRPQGQSESIQDTYAQPRKGFERQPQYYNWQTGRMG